MYKIKVTDFSARSTESKVPITAIVAKLLKDYNLSGLQNGENSSCKNLQKTFQFVQLLNLTSHVLDRHHI